MRHPKPLIILGVGGNSIDVLDAINEINARGRTPAYACIGFLDDDERLWGTSVHGVPVSGPLESAAEHTDAGFVLAVGSPSNFWRREAVAARVGLAAERYETIVHPTASVSRMSRLGPGTIVLQNATVASNVEVGRHVMILPNSVLSHDVVVGDFTCLAGGVCVSGRVSIGRSCYLGTNCSVIDGVAVGDGCLIGMGSVILADVPAGSVYVGVPGRFLRPTCPDEGPPPGAARP
ncbi:MAG TPA: acetyltransferase [Phycisphaerae bacterium]|nr:acetyltransferase [Phycisphaerae bacterium]HUU90703.1 acetyltransferase [Phycisphaerae bacterium]